MSMIDFGRFHAHVARLVQAVSASPGDTEPAVRRAVQARAAVLGGLVAAPVEGALPPDLDRYVTTVALQAYTVTDADIEALKAGGYSEDAIFEITLSAALGAAMGRIDRGLRALRGEPS